MKKKSCNNNNNNNNISNLSSFKLQFQYLHVKIKQEI
jgi:hypothetical protein